MAVVLDRSQRDAVHRFVVGELHEVGELGRALESGNLAVAGALRLRFDQDVRLLDLLGWAKADDRDRYELTMSAAEIRAVFSRLYQRATLEVEEGMSILQQLPIGEAVEAARVCGEVVLGLQPEDGDSRPTVSYLYDLPRRPACG
jgi:hypothetical protein